MKYWLVKSEPYKYSWDDMLKDNTTYWDGVRNYQARNNLKSMKKGDLVLFYHSNVGKEIVGITSVIKEFYQDPTTEDPKWVVVDLKVKSGLPRTSRGIFKIISSVKSTVEVVSITDLTVNVGV